MESDLLGIIPARYASSRFPGKPLARLGSRPMIQWVYEKASGFFQHLAVATDDERIFRVVKSFGGQVVMTDPGHRSGTERCAEAFRIMRNKHQVAYSHVVNIQGDEPLLATEQLKALTDGLRIPGASVSTLIKPLEDPAEMENPHVVKVVVDRTFKALYFSRSPIPYFRDQGPVKGKGAVQPSPATCYSHIGLYGFRADLLEKLVRLPATPLEQAESLEQLRWLEHGYTIQTTVSEIPSRGIDTPEDMEKIAHLFQ